MTVVTPLSIVIISNVPGSPTPLYSAGARLLANDPVSAIAHGVGLNITALSHEDRVDFAIVTDRDQVPDLWPLTDGQSLGGGGDDTQIMHDAERRSTGGCLCGAVRYQVRGPLRDVELCHCSRCRRTHGHVGAYTAAPASALTLIERRGLRWYAADGRERGFCGQCGASLFWRRGGSDQISVAAGTLDAPTGLRTVMHIFTDSQGDYYEITDELPRHPGSGDPPTRLGDPANARRPHSQ